MTRYRFSTSPAALAARRAASHPKVVSTVFTYPERDIGHDAHERDLLLLHSRSNEVQLVQVCVADIRTDVSFLLLLPQQTLLRLSRTRGKQAVRDFPRQKLLKGPDLRSLQLAFMLLHTRPLLEHF